MRFNNPANSTNALQVQGATHNPSRGPILIQKIKSEPREKPSIIVGHLSMKLYLMGNSSGLLKTRLKHGIELRKSRGDAAGNGSPSTLVPTENLIRPFTSCS